MCPLLSSDLAGQTASNSQVGPYNWYLSIMNKVLIVLYNFIA